MVRAHAAFAALFRARGVTGDLVPVVEPRWTRAAPLPQVAPATAPPAQAPAAADGDPPLAAASAATAAPATAGDWPQFQGPQRDASAPAVRLSRDWAARPPRLLWRQPIGEGWSGFAVSGGIAVTQEQRGEDERVVAFELASGRPLWAHAGRARYDTVIAGAGPRATPAIHDGRVFTMGGTGTLDALDLLSGRLLWTHDVAGENGAPVPDWGKSASPLVVGRTVVVSAGGSRGRSLVAYDAASGSLVWSAGSDGPSYSSPIRLTLAGRDQIVIVNSNSVAGHDPAAGAQLWRIDFPDGQPNVAVPLAIGPDRVLVSVGYGVGSKAYRIAPGAGGALEAALVWETPRLKSKFANLVAHGGYVYGLDDGVFACLDPASGDLRWKSGRYGHGQLLLAGGLILVQTEDGEMVLIDPSPEGLRELARVTALDGRTWNPPALAGRLLLVRNDREAAAYELPVE
jgi:outer membrane protein assembly factor BamB